MRERLKELINKWDKTESLANYPLKNGVVPPCKEGDTVYIVGTFTKQIVKANVLSFWWCEGEMYLLCSNGVSVSVEEQLGKTVFLTKEEAEKHLQKGTY